MPSENGLPEIPLETFELLQVRSGVFLLLDDQGLADDRSRRGHRSLELGIQVAAGRCRKQRQQLIGIAPAKVPKFGRADAVGARLTHDGSQGLFPRSLTVAASRLFQAQPSGDTEETAQCAPLNDFVDRLVQHPGGARLVEHLLYDWHAGFECKPRQQVAADAVDRTDARLSDGGGQIVPAFKDQVGADPLSKLRGRCFGERRR